MIDRKKILVLIGSLDVGGAEMDIVRNYPLINKTHEVTVLLYSHPGPLASKIEEAGVRVIARESLFRKKEVGSLSKIYKLFRLIKEITQALCFVRKVVKSEKPDIIHAFLPLSYVYATLVKISVFVQKPFLIMSRLSLNFYFAKHPILGFLERHICHRFVDVAVGNSKAILNNLKDEGVPEDKLFLLYNGIDVDAFKVNRDLNYYTAPKVLQLTSVGNLFTYKGHMDLLEALAQLKTRRADLLWNINIIGRDEQDNLAKYKDFLSKNNLESCVNFVGPSNDILSFLKNSHLHIHPSHTEGLPNSIIEAMTSSLACVGTDVGGIPELIINNETGLIVESKSPEKLSEAIETMLDDREKLYNYGKAGQKRALKLFSIKESVKRYLELYEV